MSSPKILLTVVEASAFLALSRATIYKLIYSGQLRTLKVGRSCRIPVAEINRFLAELSERQHGDPSLALESKEDRP